MFLAFESISDLFSFGWTILNDEAELSEEFWAAEEIM